MDKSFIYLFIVNNIVPMSTKHTKLHPVTGTTDHDLTGLVPGQLLGIDSSGSTIASSGIYAFSGSLSANTIFSAGTNLYDIFGTGNSGVATKFYIGSGETVTIDANIEYFIYGNLTLDGGTINNSGKIVVMNGSFINSGGTYNQISGGSMSLVSSQTINKFTFVTGLTANTPLVITHNLGTNDVVIAAKNLNTNQKIVLGESAYNLNDVTIESTQTISNIKITIIG